MIPLSVQLEAGLAKKKITVEDLSARTKVPAFSIQSFLGVAVMDALPERVYRRGHLGLLARELDLDVSSVLEAFDAAFPLDKKPENSVPAPTFGRREIALAAGLAGVGLLAVALAFASVLD